MNTEMRQVLQPSNSSHLLMARLHLLWASTAESLLYVAQAWVPTPHQ